MIGGADYTKQLGNNKSCGILHDPVECGAINALPDVNRDNLRQQADNTAGKASSAATKLGNSGLVQFRFLTTFVTLSGTVPLPKSLLKRWHAVHRAFVRKKMIARVF